jgi:hypothetical protein
MPTTNFFMPGESFPFCKGSMERERRNRRRQLTVQIPRKTEPEGRLWKLSMEAASLPKLELILFLFFGVLVSAAEIYCGTELSHVVNDGALEQTVQALLMR